MLVRTGKTQFCSQVSGGVTILEVRGDIDHLTVDGFHEALAAVNDAPLVIDFCACGKLNAQGEEAVLRRQRRTPATFAIVCEPDAQPSHAYLLRLIELVPHYPTREQALAAVAAREAWSRGLRPGAPRPR